MTGPTTKEQSRSALGELQPWLNRPQLAAVLPKMRSLPAMPETHKQVSQALKNPDFSLAEVEALIAKDISLTAQILKVANSALFGRTEPVLNVGDAIQIIGGLRMRALVSTAWAFKLIDEKNICAGFNPHDEWEHALTVAMEAQQLGMMCRASAEKIETAFTAGMLHDFGKLVMAVDNPKHYAMVTDEAATTERVQHEVETEMLGYHHGELGACLLGLWGIPFQIVQAVGWHHNPDDAPEKGLTALALVHVANCNVRKIPADCQCVEVINVMNSYAQKEYSI